MDYVNNFLTTLLPGFIQGITRVSISYPFDYIRIYLQKNRYKNTIDFLKHNDKNYKNLYRGIRYPLSIIPLDRAITFKLYEDLNKKYNPLISSFSVSLITCLYNVPLQSISTNYVLQNHTKGYFEFIREMLNKNKTNFIFKSYSVEYSRGVLGSGLYMGIYGNLRNNIPNEKKYHMVNGIFTSLVTWTLLYPLDTIRVEHQTNNMKLSKTIKDKYNIQGIRSFYKGIGLVYLRTIPSAALGMLTYEMTRNFINKNYDNN